MCFAISFVVDIQHAYNGLWLHTFVCYLNGADSYA